MDCQNEYRRLERLQRPKGKVRVVIDTDTFNEIDDQYALAYAMSVPDRLQVEALYAAPFYNRLVSSPAEGTKKSYEEILRLLPLLHREDLRGRVYCGSLDYLKDEASPQKSDAAANLVKLAMETPEGEVLYVAALGAITNIASALLMEPRIADKIVIVWLGGHEYSYRDTKEFNLIQDVAAVRVVFDSHAPLIQIPCRGVASHLLTTEPELRERMKGKGEIGDYLYRITCEIAGQECGRCWSRVIWDLAVIMWICGPEDCMTDHLEHSPVVSYDGRYSMDYTRPLIKVVDWIKRDKVFAEFFDTLTGR